MIQVKLLRFLVLPLMFCAFTSCSPTLTFTEVEERINSDYTAFNEGNVEYEVGNTPKKYLKEYGENGVRKKIQEIYSDRKYPSSFGVIGELKIQDRNKCLSTYFYKVKYLVDKVQMTPYLDSTALKLNYKSYGKKNVKFNPNSKILQIRLTKEEILIFDKDRKWKLLPFDNFDSQLFDRIFGKGFSECIKSEVGNSEYLPY